MVPLMSMVRHHLQNQDKNREIIFLISTRTSGHVLYKEELEKIVTDNPNIKVVKAITDAPDPANYNRRIDEEMFKEVFGNELLKMPNIYICGPTKFVEVAADLCVKMGVPPNLVHTERFGG
jgi:ferredoxin-NADP reductase